MQNPLCLIYQTHLQKLDRKEGQLRKHCKLLVKVNDACFIYELKDIVDCSKKKMTDG